ncbi:uncharacterized protein LOC108666597 [Hyalella azteca]|uniref:Uncharacterized protein LOC108666597 n=1 Tax=Hyalella azteca TaxID=294128 RepID=A0A8B7N570_HYAAZ|nr:uncharacterized protein LOC108666597 [Hyalella azteca]
MTKWNSTNITLRISLLHLIRMIQPQVVKAVMVVMMLIILLMFFSKKQQQQLLLLSDIQQLQFLTLVINLRSQATKFLHHSSSQGCMGFGQPLPQPGQHTFIGNS